jgi:NAD(P)-dependent dehydrogenase (short-subunit alcohol dehydrogenase family)
MKTNTLIIGSSSGIGLEATKFFLKKSHNVIGISRRNNNIKSKKFRHINFDLNNFQDYDQLYSNIYNKFGPINNLLFSAGVQFIRPSSIISANDIKKIFNINLKSPILFSKFISNKRFFKRPGSVIFISSVIASRPASGQSLYGSSKSGVINHAKSLALEVSKYKININTISPGMLKGPMLSKYSKNISKDIYEKITKQHPLGIGKFTDIVNGIDFLFSSKSRWITGIDLTIDGGYSL